MRALVQFGKQGRLRFVSHLDLQRFMQRALRRSNLPVAYSQGFNPHVVMAFSSALGTGVSSEAEILDIKLAEEASAEQVLGAMRASLPPEMPVYRVRLVDDHFPALMAKVYCSDYQITLSGPGKADVFAQVPLYLQEEEVLAMRKSKSGMKQVNIRPMTLLLEPAGEDSLRARLMLTEQATLKPDLLISALAERSGAQEYRLLIHRTQLLTQGADGTLIPLFDMPE